MKQRTLYQARTACRSPGADLAPRHALGSRSLGFGFPILLGLGLLLAGTMTGLTQTKNMNDSTNHLEVATLGGGCFWCTEAVFQMLPGVKSVTCGYAGGTKVNPTYKEVCSGNTGHAEVIQIEVRPQGDFLRKAARDLLGGP